MKEKKIKVGDMVSMISFKTLEAKGAIDVLRVTNYGCIIKDNTVGLESTVSTVELKEWNTLKKVERVSKINGVEVIETNNLYYPTKWIRRRIC